MADTPTPGTLPPVELLEGILQRARAGEFASVAVAMVKHDGCTAQNWSALPSFISMYGSVIMLNEGIVDWICTLDDEPRQPVPGVYRPDQGQR